MKTLKVFKFGGASVKDGEAIKNVSKILELYQSENILVVVSAMGKTTNLLEDLIKAYWAKSNDKYNHLNKFSAFNLEIITFLNLQDPKFEKSISKLNAQLKSKIEETPSDNFHFEYDQIVSFGELYSTTIIAAYLNQINGNTIWLDTREVIRTNNSYREARVNWEKTQTQFDEKVIPFFKNEPKIVVTQGFIGRTDEGMTTTLGREGSDFTASIYAHIGNAVNVTIWKDVPGMLNADPKYFSGTVLLSKISFTEAVELAYYGASVIHPKTIQPLKNKEIPLFIKSFINPKEAGTVIQSSTKYDTDMPSYIFKEDQILISITPKDFSFVVEDQLTEIFSVLSKEKVRINLMQNSAISFSFLIDNKYDLVHLVKVLKNQYIVKYNEGLELLTIRHFNEDTIARLTEGKVIILTQKTRETARIILE